MLPTHHNMRQRGQPERRLSVTPPTSRQLKPTNSWEIDDHVVIGIDNGYLPQEHGSRQDRTYQHETLPSAATPSTPEQQQQQQQQQPPPARYSKPPLSTNHIQLDKFHTVFRRPHHVPDHQYATFMYGTQTRPTTNYRTVALQFCTLFSGIGTAFMLLIAILLDVQPLYIAGSLPLVENLQGDSSSKSRAQYSLPIENRLDVCKTAYQTALLYAVLCALCLLLTHPNVVLQYTKRRHYETLPDHHHPGPRQDTYWTKLVQGIRRYLTLRGYIRPRKRPGKRG